MAYYPYYQNGPGWGTDRYQSIPPPPPQYQPQPSWTGRDYYSAHAGNQDNSLFDYILAKLRRMVVGTGVGRKRAIHWWKRVYSGLVDPAQLLPRDLGAAAGYEALRSWEHYQSIYVQPLSANREREKEGLMGLAIAEATKLWAYTQRPTDTYGRLEACEVAAATASRLFTKSYDYDSPYDPYVRNHRTRKRSVSATRYDDRRGMLDDGLDSPYEMGARMDYLDAPRRGRRLSRSGSVSPFQRPLSAASFGSRSPSPMGYGRMGMGNPSVGMTTSAVNYPSAMSFNTTSAATYPSAIGSNAVYDPILGPGIQGTYYPQAVGSTPYYNQANGHSPYSQFPVTPGYAAGMGGISPYGGNSPYVGSTVGLPPPPGAASPYLGVPNALGLGNHYHHHRHRRARSASAYGGARPTFEY